MVGLVVMLPVSSSSNGALSAEEYAATSASTIAATIQNLGRRTAGIVRASAFAAPLLVRRDRDRCCPEMIPPAACRSARQPRRARDAATTLTRGGPATRRCACDRRRAARRAPRSRDTPADACSSARSGRRRKTNRCARSRRRTSPPRANARWRRPRRTRPARRR